MFYCSRRRGQAKQSHFCCPILPLLSPDKTTVQCLILAPSRELAAQIAQVWQQMGTGYKVNVCYGGHSMTTEIQNLSNPPALLIGTPGRIADHITRRTFELDGIRTLVLDEFDKSLALGFEGQMSFILRHLRKLKRKILVSATKAVEIPEFVGITEPTTLNFIPENQEKLSLTLQIVRADEKIS